MATWRPVTATHLDRGSGRPGLVLLTWVPIGVAIVLTTVIRFVVLLATWNGAVATILGFLPGGVIVIWVGRTVVRASAGDPGGTRLRLAIGWGVASIAFRTLWVGLLLGGGWGAVVADYQVWTGQPWLLLLLLIVMSPFLVRLPPAPVVSS